MENRLAKKETIDQVPSIAELEAAGGRFENLGDFLDHVKLGIRAMVRTMLQTYAEDEFTRFVGAKPYERTLNRRDHRNGHRKRTLDTRFGVIDNLEIPRGRKSGLGSSTILARYRRQDSRIEEIVSEIFLRGVSTRKIAKISRLLWGAEVSPSEVSRMNKRVKKELIRWLNRPITKRIAYLIIDGAYFKVRRKRVSKEAAL